MSVGLRKARTVSEVHVGGWFDAGYGVCVCGERVLSVQSGERRERDEEEGQRGGLEWWVSACGWVG